MTIARALVNNPAVVIADEPTAHLDTKLSRDFLGIMERLNAEGKTILIASHDPLVYESGHGRPGGRDARRQDPRLGAGGMILHPAVIALLIGLASSSP